jgi:hypothetical protein
MRQVLSRALALLLASAPLLHPAPEPGPEPVPGAADTLARARAGLNFQPTTLAGHLRTAKARHPLRLTAGGNTLVYELPDAGLAWRVTFQPTGAALAERGRNGSFTAVPAARRDDIVLGSDLVPQDLTLDFLFWPNVTPDGTDTLKTRRCFVYDVRPPSGGGRFDRVRLWLDAAGAALLRADAYNAQGQCIKRFEVNSVQQIENTWIIREFQVSTMMPDRNLSKSRTYLTLDPIPKP